MKPSPREQALRAMREAVATSGHRLNRFSDTPVAPAPAKKSPTLKPPAAPSARRVAKKKKARKP
jgi:hypothetical protein